MRVTKGRIRSAHKQSVQEMYEKVKTRFGFIDQDIVVDMFRVLENREAILKREVIFGRTLQEYKDGKIKDIFDAYYARTAWARFLKMMTESPHYPKDESQNEAFFARMWDLLAELWKRDLPMLQQILQQAGMRGGGRAVQQARSQAGIDQLGRLVDYGQKILELLKDPLFQKLFKPPLPPKPQNGKDDDDSKGGKSQNKGKGNSEEDEDSDDQSPSSGKSNGTGQDVDGDGDKKSDEEEQGGGNSSGGDYGQGTSTLDQVTDAFKAWHPFMVEAVLFSQDLKLVAALNPKGDWNPTPYPDKSVDVHKIRDSRDLVKLLPSEHALPSDLFYLKYAKKELLCREFMAKCDRKQILYILMDTSGSMRQPSEKVKMVGSVAISLLRKVAQNGDTYFLRFFDWKTSELHKASTLGEAQDLVAQIIRQSFFGSDTKIHGAVMTAINDIKNAARDTKAPADLKDCQILLLTDGIDPMVNADVIKKAKGDIKIHSVVIHCSDPYGKVKKFSDSYYEVGRDETLSSAVKLVKVFDQKSKRKYEKEKADA